MKIDNGADLWIKEIDNFINKERENDFLLVKNKKYDINDVVDEFVKIVFR